MAGEKVVGKKSGFGVTEEVKTTEMGKERRAKKRDASWVSFEWEEEEVDGNYWSTKKWKGGRFWERWSDDPKIQCVIEMARFDFTRCNAIIMNFFERGKYADLTSRPSTSDNDN